mmetsp:Transcript_48329/g.125347  ORF Transcript_48329/g.125347 Transcript_48329/m.125347 type:complete len:232 (+) Transcript_48329:810-1505(+)
MMVAAKLWPIEGDSSFSGVHFEISKGVDISSTRNDRIDIDLPLHFKYRVVLSMILNNEFLEDEVPLLLLIIDGLFCKVLQLLLRQVLDRGCFRLITPPQHHRDDITFESLTFRHEYLHHIGRGDVLRVPLLDPPVLRSEVPLRCLPIHVQQCIRYGHRKAISHTRIIYAEKVPQVGVKGSTHVKLTLFGYPRSHVPHLSPLLLYYSPPPFSTPLPHPSHSARKEVGRQDTV